MNQKIRSTLIIFFALIVGLVLNRMIPMLYFVGFILVFIILMGQNQMVIRNPQRYDVKNLKRHDIPLAIIGYILAGVLYLFF